jgi:Arc/MetJ-type ribon-helix-helix transcriptional regulator
MSAARLVALACFPIRMYSESMKTSARSSITLPGDEVALVERLRRRVGAKSNVAVVRRALRLLEATTDREQLRRAYREASSVTRAGLPQELEELDHLAGEGLDD